MDRLFPVFVVQEVCVDWGQAAMALPPGFACGSRPAGVYSDCTWYHLPAWNGSADLLRNADAIFAIFAARMARSSLEIRSRFK